MARSDDKTGAPGTARGGAQQRGGNGDDALTGTSGHDRIEGGNGDDTLTGGDGDDTLAGGNHDDSIAGGAGDDSLDGGNHDDRIDGGAGDDTLRGGNHDDTLDGGAGNDVLDGGTGADSLTGGDGDDTILGGHQDDTIDGGDGDDAIDGGTGNDSIAGGHGDDSILGGHGDDTIAGGAGDDAIDGGTGDDSLSGSAGDDTVWGGHGDDVVSGGSGDDSLDGGTGDDSLSGGSGDDTIEGGYGTDTMTGGAGTDTFVIGPGSGSTRITDFARDGDGVPVDRLDVSSLVGGSGPGGRVLARDVRVSEDDGAARLLFPQGESVTLQGLSAGDVDEALLTAMGVPCFTPGVLIATARGPVPVERLRPGDRVQSADDGLREVLWTGRRRLSGADIALRPDLAPVRLRPGALGNARPMMVSPQHRFRVTGPALVEVAGRSEAFLRARFLPGLPGMGARVVRRCGGVTYVHVLLDRHAVIFAEGAATEPLWPGPQALRCLAPGERAEIFALFPDLAPLLSLPGPRARARVAEAYAPLARPELSRRDLRDLGEALGARGTGRAA